MSTFQLKPGQLDLADIRYIVNNPVKLTLSADCIKLIQESRKTVEQTAQQDEAVYGINTGFGSLAQTKISVDELVKLQHNIVISHAAGTGKLLDKSIVRLILLLKINSLARGYSGIRLEVINALIELFNQDILPCIPAKGSVGASGDLAPLAHLSLPLIGEGFVHFNNEILPTTTALKQAKIKPVVLAAKEGLALLNGTQVSTGIALYQLLQAEKVFSAALLSGALSIDAAQGSDVPFDERIHQIRNHQAQITVAQVLRELLQDSEIRQSHADCDRVQDPYSLRCQPQVMGACLMNLEHAANVLVNETNAVTDNPLVFAKDNAVLSGGNFHAEPVAIVADLIAICIAEIGAISERRIALLVDKNHNGGLPAFLVKTPGVNSGFMLSQYTAASLASENKTLAHPASVDSIPTCANQEDHVSMATFAACRLTEIIDNVVGIIAIELLAACQGIDLRAPLKTSTKLQTYHQTIRQRVAFYDKDRYFAPDIETMKNYIYQDLTLIYQFLTSSRLS